MWIKKAFKDYYKPKLRRQLKHDPTIHEMDLRFEEIYSRCNGILLVGVNEGVSIQFYEIARFSKKEIDKLKPDLKQIISTAEEKAVIEKGVVKEKFFVKSITILTQFLE